MNKRTYTRPIVKTMELSYIQHLAAGTNNESEFDNARKLNDYSWDDEEEEIEDSMWK